MPKKKTTLVNNSYILQPIGFWQRSHVVQYVLLLNEKVRTDPIKHKGSMMDTIRACLENPINSLTKYLWKKVRAVITPTFFKRFWFCQRC